MAIIALPKTWISGDTLTANDLNSQFTTISNDYNGNITNANIASGAAISTSKINATFPSGTIVGTTDAQALTNKTITSHLAYADTRYFVGSLSRDLTLASGNVAYTGVGFAPKSVIFFANVSGNNRTSWGMNTSSGGGMAVFDDTGDIANAYDITNAGTAAIMLLTVSGTRQFAAIASYDSDGFTLTWTKQGSPTGTGTVIYLAMR